MTFTAADQSQVAAVGTAIEPADMRRARIYGVLFAVTFGSIWKCFKPSPILDTTRYAGVGAGSASAALAAS